MGDGREVVMYNVHNFGLIHAQVEEVSHALAHDIDTAKELPQELSVLVVGISICSLTASPPWRLMPPPLCCLKVTHLYHLSCSLLRDRVARSSA